MSEITKPEKASTRTASHMPKDSVFFEKIVPALLILMSALTAALVLLAVGVLLGIVRF
jgi:hypothetical protein